MQTDGIRQCFNALQARATELVLSGEESHEATVARAFVEANAKFLAGELEWDLKSPCGDCPFRKSSPFHLGVATSLPTYLKTIDENRFAHTCHKTDSRPEVDGPRTWQGATKHCAGALMMLLKTGDGKDLQLPLLHAMEDDKFDVEEMTRLAKENADVFTLDELIAFYLAELEKLRCRS